MSNTCGTNLPEYPHPYAIGGPPKAGLTMFGDDRRVGPHSPPLSSGPRRPNTSSRCTGFEDLPAGQDHPRPTR